MQFPLVGEQEDFEGKDYQVAVECPEGFEWVHSALTYQPFELVEQQLSRVLNVTILFEPRKPFRHNLQVVVENPLGQKWRFVLRTTILQAEPMKTIVIDSPLNVETSKRVEVDEPIRQRTYFKAYFAPGSTTEFRLIPTHGVLEASLGLHNELPIDIVFFPTTYGKAMRGVLVVDTYDVEFVFEVLGRFPEYVPPLIEFSGRIDTTIPESARLAQSERKVKRNIIRDNIESVKLARPKTTRIGRKLRPPFLY
jgi:hypothetical protein